MAIHLANRKEIRWEKSMDYPMVILTDYHSGYPMATNLVFLQTGRRSDFLKVTPMDCLMVNLKVSPHLGMLTDSHLDCLKDCLKDSQKEFPQTDWPMAKHLAMLTVTRSVTLRACLLTVMRLVNWKGNHWAMLMDFDLVIHLDCLKDSHSVIQKVTLKVFPQMVKHWVNHLVTHWVNHLDLLKVYPLKAMRWGYQMDFQMAKLTVKTMV